MTISPNIYFIISDPVNRIGSSFFFCRVWWHEVFAQCQSVLRAYEVQTVKCGLWSSRSCSAGSDTFWKVNSGVPDLVVHDINLGSHERGAHTCARTSGRAECRRTPMWIAPAVLFGLPKKRLSLSVLYRLTLSVTLFHRWRPCIKKTNCQNLPQKKNCTTLVNKMHLPKYNNLLPKTTVW